MKPKIPAVVERFARYHAAPGGGAWGSLHIVLDDGNHKDSHVEGCIEYAQRRGDAEGEALARILLTMSKSQRGRIGTKADEFLRKEEEARLAKQPRTKPDTSQAAFDRLMANFRR